GPSWFISIALHDALPNSYAYRKVEKDGEKTETRSMTIEKALADEKWDYISVQQASPLSGIYDSYKASLPELVNYIRERIGKETRSEEHTSELQSRFDLVC